MIAITDICFFMEPLTYDHNKQFSMYRRPSLSAGLLSAVLTIRGLLILYKTCYPRTFPLVIRGFGPFLVAKRLFKAQNSVPLLFAVLVFAGYSWDVTPANNEGRLYINNIYRVQLVINCVCEKKHHHNIRFRSFCI